MKHLSIATAGAALLALGTTAASPVVAGTIGFNYYADVEGNYQILPQLSSYLPLPNSGSFDEEYDGMFVLDDDPNQWLDGDLSLGPDFFSSYLSGLFGVNISEDTINLLDDNFDLSLTGAGTLNSNLGSLDFDLGWDSDENSVKLIFDPSKASIIDGCLVGLCQIEHTTDVILTAVTNFLGTDITVGTLTVEKLKLTTIPKSITKPKPTPEPVSLLGLIGVGGFLASRRKKVKA